MARKATGKATGKGKTASKGKTPSLATRVAKRVAGASGDKGATKSATTSITVIGSGAKGHTMVTAEKLATTLGISGKRLRGWLRSDGTGALGNDHIYTRYGIDVDHKDGKALVAAATARFKR